MHYRLAECFCEATTFFTNHTGIENDTSAYPLRYARPPNLGGQL